MMHNTSSDEKKQQLILKTTTNSTYWCKKNEFKLQHKFELIYNFIDEKSSEYEEQQ